MNHHPAKLVYLLLLVQKLMNKNKENRLSQVFTKQVPRKQSYRGRPQKQNPEHALTHLDTAASPHDTCTEQGGCCQQPAHLLLRNVGRAPGEDVQGVNAHGHAQGQQNEGDELNQVAAEALHIRMAVGGF
eukprot:1150028-Pelagomonas_calceolata.AAC.8